MTTLSKEEVEALVIKDYEQLRGRLIRAAFVECCNDVGYDTMVLDDPVVLRIIDMELDQGVLRWMGDGHCDPAYDVELVTSTPEADGWLAHGDYHVSWVYGPSRSTRGEYTKPTFKVIATPARSCECDDGLLPGAITETFKDGTINVERCDACGRFEGDLDAAWALAKQVSGRVLFYQEPPAGRAPEIEEVREFTGTYRDDDRIATGTDPWVTDGSLALTPLRRWDKNDPAVRAAVGQLQSELTHPKFSAEFGLER